MALVKTPSGWSQTVQVYKSVAATNPLTKKKVWVNEVSSSYSFSKSGMIVITGKENSYPHGYFILPVVEKNIGVSTKSNLNVTDMSGTLWTFDGELNKLLDVFGCDMTPKGKRGVPELNHCDDKLVIDLGEGRTVDKLSNMMTVRTDKAQCKVPVGTLIKHVGTGDPALKYTKEQDIKNALIKANSSCGSLYYQTQRSDPASGTR